MGLFSFPSAAKAAPKRIEATMSGSISNSVRDSKRLGVTNSSRSISTILMFSLPFIISGISPVRTAPPSPGCIRFTSTIPIVTAIAVVDMKYTNVLRPSEPSFSTLMMLRVMETIMSGSTIILSAFMNSLPRNPALTPRSGYNEPVTPPRITPAIMPKMR